MKSKRVGEIMIPLELFPVVPYWFTLRQALGQLEDFEIKRRDQRTLPWILLVFNAQNELLGMVGRREILRGLEPSYSRISDGITSSNPGSIRFDASAYRLGFSEENALRQFKRQADRQISEFMHPIRETVDYNEHPLIAIYLMINMELSFIPVVRDRQIVGLAYAEDIISDILRQIP